MDCSKDRRADDGAGPHHPRRHPKGTTARGRGNGAAGRVQGAAPAPPPMSARCFWVPEGDGLYAAYHDREWGMPIRDDVRLFETLSLEAFQSGLSWRTILGKRDGFRRAFHRFDFRVLAGWDGDDVTRLLGDAGIVRHRGKIEATLHNAARACEIADEEGSLAALVWRFEPDASARPDRMDEATLRTLGTSAESVALARALKARGWRFVGPTTAYAFMQSAGLVNDHQEGCAARTRVAEARRGFSPPS